MAPYIVLALRLILPLSIFRWPLGGAIVSIAADTVDMAIFRHYGWGTLPPDRYQFFDKYLDLYYLTFEALVVLRFQEAMWRNIGIGLFVWRFVGVLIFEITGIRKILFFAPNLFENFYLIAQLRNAASDRIKLAMARYVLPVALIAIGPKIVLEYLMHYRGIAIGLGTLWAFVR